ncbi:uncharacterized protein LOC142335923 isoform X3 [Convolutriloba macropyga]|uniref:uncharacterized protein LOC142335923 isoform X3 n=1 Tax=Convolutriloba macropyga TaxID=536237 RepID=UPI003F525DA8
MDENADFNAVQEALESSFGDQKIKTEEQNEEQNCPQSDYIETSEIEEPQSEVRNDEYEIHNEVLTEQISDSDKNDNSDDIAIVHKSDESSETTNIDEQSSDNKQNSDDEEVTNKTTSSSSIDVLDENDDDEIDHDYNGKNVFEIVEKIELNDKDIQHNETVVNELFTSSPETNINNIEQVNNEEQSKQDDSDEICHNEIENGSQVFATQENMKSEIDEPEETVHAKDLLKIQPPNSEVNNVNDVNKTDVEQHEKVEDMVDVCSQNVGPNNELKVDNENIETVDNKQSKQTCSDQQQQQDLQHKEDSATKTLEPSRTTEIMTETELTITNGSSEAERNSAADQDSPKDTPEVANKEPEVMADTKPDATVAPKQSEMNGPETAASEGKTSRPQTPISKRGSLDRASITSATSKGDPTQPENNETVSPPPNPTEVKGERRPSGAISPVVLNGDVAGAHDTETIQTTEVNEPQRKISQTSVKSNTAETVPLEPERKTSIASATNDKKDPDSKRNSNVSETIPRVGTPIDEPKPSTTETTEEPKPTTSETTEQPEPITSETTEEPKPATTELEDGDQTESSTSGQIEIREKSDSIKSGDKEVELNGESSDSSDGGVGQPRATSALSGVGELSVINEGDEKTSQSYEKCDRAQVPANLNADGTEAIQTPTEEVIVNNPIVSTTTPATPEQPQTSSSNPPKQTTIEENGNSPNGERGPTPGASPEHDANNKDNNNPAEDNSPTSAFERSINNERHNSTKWWQVTKKGSTSTSGPTGGDKIDPSGCCSIL